MIICVHQFIRPTSEVQNNRPYGVGNCNTCIPDKDNNPNCTQYVPVTISTFDITDN